MLKLSAHLNAYYEDRVWWDQTKDRAFSKFPYLDCTTRTVVNKWSTVQVTRTDSLLTAFLFMNTYETRK